jgi:hypothetical protein
MLQSLYDNYSRLVPHLSDARLEKISTDITFVRRELILRNRSCILGPLVNRAEYPDPPFPPRESLFVVLHSPPDELMVHVRPQQSQYISLLVDSLHRNPFVTARALASYSKHCAPSEIRFLVSSVIPSLYGFYTTNEHISLAFPFFCSLVGYAPHEFVTGALSPFFCSPATLKFTEAVFRSFGLKFCHDVRYDLKEFQNSLIGRYGGLFVRVISSSYFLLPRPHQVLLEYLLNNKWSPRDVLNFFLRDFVMPMLLRYVRATPFKHHFRQIHFFSRYVHADTDFIQPLSEIFRHSNSAFEVPFGFNVFDMNYIQLLLTPADVHVVMTALAEIDAVPPNIRPFQDPRIYLQEIDYQSFFVRVYSKKPPPTSPTAFRPLVFQQKINDFKHTENPDFERLWLELVNACAVAGDSPFDRYRRAYTPFAEYVLCRSLDELDARATIFEHYLVHLMYLRTLIDWSGFVKYYYDLIMIPSSAARVTRELKSHHFTKLSAFDSCIATLVTKFPLIEYPLIVETFLPLILTKERVQRLARVEALWTACMMDARSAVVLPEALQKVKLQQRLWEAIEHLKCVGFVRFGSKLQVVLEALMQLEKLAEIDDVVLMFAAVYCDCTKLPGYFLMLNALVVRGGVERVFWANEKELVLWYKFESAILKLVRADQRLMSQYLACQTDLGFVEFR